MMQNPGKLIFAAMLLAAPVAMAQTAPQTDDGARPGNDIGTRSSLPLSPNASNINAGDTNSSIAPTPPEPSVPPGASPGMLLQSAMQSLSANHTGTADEALEMAETDLLQRAVPADAAETPSADPVVTQIEQARQQIGDRDYQGASGTINQILSSNAPELGM